MEIFMLILYLGFIAFSFWLFYVIVKNAAKNGIKEALLELRLLDDAAVRTIDVQNKNDGGGGGKGGNYI